MMNYMMNCNNNIIKIVDRFKNLLKIKVLDALINKIYDDISLEKYNKFKSANKLIRNYSKNDIFNKKIEQLSLVHDYNILIKIK